MAKKKSVSDFEKRVRAFQERNKLTVDGDFGPLSLGAVEALEKDCETMANELNSITKKMMQINKTIENQTRTIKAKTEEVNEVKRIMITQTARISFLEAELKRKPKRCTFFEWLRTLFVGK